MIFYEFFCGGGMANAGLSPWTCSFANDFSPMKVAAYRANFGGNHLFEGDIAKITSADLPGQADLAWASFPCQDLSLAGAGKGLGTAQKTTRSGTFWVFMGLMEALRAEGRAPKTIVLENVLGALTSQGGKDFEALCGALADCGYRYGALVVDAVHFLPQSRPRVFVIAVREDINAPPSLTATPDDLWHPPSMRRAVESFDPPLKDRWFWWRLPAPIARKTTLADILEPDNSVMWRDNAYTWSLISSMSNDHRDRVNAEMISGRRAVGAVYKRTRGVGASKRVRAEVRFDGIAGCLRTPSGGSSRQTILVIDQGIIRSRLLTAREAARLMGLPDTYILPNRYNDAYHVCGDGVAVPVVAYLREHLLEPLLRDN